MVSSPLYPDSPSRQIGEWAATLRWSDLPESTHSHSNLRLLDTVGLIMVGATTDAGRVTTNLAASKETNGTSTLVGNRGRRASCATAAMVHGTLAHCRDFDDTFVDSVVHPGSVIIPTALAVAEACNASEEDFGLAMVLGYEVAARVGAVAGRKFHAHGFHATGVVGPIAAAVTAGRLLQLSGEQMSWAIGLACSMSGGLMAFLTDGGWSKWLHTGWAAHGGITAAELASKGFRGPEYVLQGKHDLYGSLLCNEPVDRSALTTGLGSKWLGSAAAFKYYPCAHVIQPYIDAALTIVRQNNLYAADIEAIVCGIAPWAAAIVAEPREAKLQFGTELEAIASLPYQLATAVLDRRVDLRALQAQHRRRPDILQLAKRIIHRSDASLGQSFDGDLEIRTTSGQRFCSQVAVAAPDAQRITEKFITNFALFCASSDTQLEDSDLTLNPEFEARAQALAAALLSHDVPNWKSATAILDQPPQESVRS